MFPSTWRPWGASARGPRSALVLFSLVAAAGYLVYFLSPSWEVFLAGTFLVLAWDSMSQPAIFSLIGESLGRSKRAMGFSVQSILKRVPIVVAPPLGGLLISRLGLVEGMKVGFLVSVALSVAAAYLQHRFYRGRAGRPRGKASIAEVWREARAELKLLLAADCLARFGSYMASEYIVLYVMNVFRASPIDYGLLVSVQMTTSILGYLPAAKAADVYGRRPFILATFTFFSLYTLALGLTPTASLLPLAFVVAGLREIGEPARKALIVDLAEGPSRGQTIGLYYLVRETIGIPAPLLGALLWTASPRLLFFSASAVSAVGVVVYALTPVLLRR